jgi:hypothetical protein
MNMDPIIMTIATMASNLQSESYSAIRPYVILPTYRLLVCQVCGFASVADEVATHLRTRHRDLVLPFCNGFLLFVAWFASLSLCITILGLSQADNLGGLAPIVAVVLTSAAIIAIVTAAGTITLQLTFEQLESLKQRWTTINPFNPNPMLVFKGKGLKGDHPCIILLDRELPKNTRVFAFKIAEAEIKQDGGVMVPSECGLLLTPRTDQGQERGAFVRVGIFEIRVSRMHRDWLDHTALFKSRTRLREEIWSNPGIEERFYKEKDNNGRCTIKIV